MTEGFWTHEEGSTIMFEYLVDTHPTRLDNALTQDDIKQICRLVRGGPIEEPGRDFLYEIVSNSRNGIDVDKIDYLLRDTQKINVPYCSFNHERIMLGTRVVDNQICYPENKAFEIKKLFDSRYNMYRDCYYHRVTQSIECLILDILMETHDILYNYLEAIYDPEQYLNLEDSVLHEVRLSTEPEL